MHPKIVSTHENTIFEKLFIFVHLEYYRNHNVKFEVYTFYHLLDVSITE
jgi:hypothetical protein